MRQALHDAHGLKQVQLLPDEVGEVPLARHRIEAGLLVPGKAVERTGELPGIGPHALALEPCERLAREARGLDRPEPRYVRATPVDGAVRLLQSS